MFERFSESSLCVLLLWIISVCGYAHAADQPNVLFVIMDDMNNDLHFLDGRPQAKTVNLERLASSGLVFKRIKTVTGGLVDENAL
jgi:hypothetical protein